MNRPLVLLGLAVVLFPGCGGVSKYLHRGQRLYTGGNLSEAESEFKSAIASQPGDAEGYFWLGVTYCKAPQRLAKSSQDEERFEVRRSRNKEIFKDIFLNRLTAVALDMGQAQWNRADALGAALVGVLCVNEMIDAKAKETILLTVGETLDKAIRIDPGHSEANFLLGHVFCGLGELAMAERRFQTILNSEPGEVYEHMARMFLLMFTPGREQWSQDVIDEVKSNIEILRSAVTAYHEDKKGKWPKTIHDDSFVGLEEHRYIPHIPREPFTGSRRIQYLREAEGPADGDGKGGWLYKAGQIWVNLGGNDSQGVRYHEY